MQAFAFDEVEDGLFLGPCPSSPEAVQALAERGVTQLLSVQTDDDIRGMGLSWDLLWNFLMRSGIAPVRIQIVDFNDQSLRRNLPEAVSSLEMMLRMRQPVFVHCSVGIHRSSTVVVAYLMAVRGMEMDAAIALVRERRAIVQPNRNALQGWVEDGGLRRYRR